jgi:hypothetical protein
VESFISPWGNLPFSAREGHFPPSHFGGIIISTIDHRQTFFQQFYGAFKEAAMTVIIFVRPYFVFSCFMYHGGVASTSTHPYLLSLLLPLLLCHCQPSPLLFAADVLVFTLIMSSCGGVLCCPYPLRCWLSPFLVAPDCDCQHSLLQPPPPFSALVAGWLLSGSSRRQQGWASSVAVVIFIGPLVL